MSVPARERGAWRRTHERELKFFSRLRLRGTDIRLGRFCFALIAAFSEVSGEAAYKVSMMHLGAIGSEGVPSIWRLHTHTARYCYMSTMLSYTLALLYRVTEVSRMKPAKCMHVAAMKHQQPCMRQALSSCNLAAQHFSDFTYSATSHGRCDDHISYTAVSFNLACRASDNHQLNTPTVIDTEAASAGLPSPL